MKATLFNKPTIVIAFILALIIDGSAQTTFVSGENPIFRNSFTADPAPLVHNGRLYVYVGKDEAKDGEMFTMTAWLCYSTTDMKNWTYHGPVMKPTDFTWAVADAWASQVVARNGKFYLYVTVTGKNQYSGRAVGVAVSDSPTGPFVDAKGTPLVYESMTQNGKAWDDIDPTVLIDDDGTAYLAWGNPFCYFAKLKPNMTEIDGAITRITPPNYAEGPWLHKRNGIYYLTYAAFVAPTGSEQICCSTATNINGPWTYRGILTGTARNSYTIHPGIVEYKGQWYLFYHNATLTLNGQGPALGRRSVCVEYLCYNADGTMKPVTQTTAGITVSSPCPPSGIPSVSLTSPSNNTVYTAPATVNLAATASDPDGTISKVEFYNGSMKLGEDASSPYAFSWTNVAAGTYTITAVATDNSGNKTTSSAITIKVNPPQGPYNGTAHVIPGTIQFEAYDVGGNGFAYLDNSPGSAVTPVVNFRTTEDVDIENCTDAGAGYNIGWATAGEWLEYTVNVQTSGVYTLDLRVACNIDGRTLSVSMGGTNIASNVAIPNTAGWQTWQTVTLNNISLTAGQKIMRVTIGATDYINLNYVTFTLSSPPVATITPVGATTFCSGGSVVLNASTGTGYTYQWKKEGSNISNATTSSYTATQTGSYTVAVTANSQTVTSSVVIVTVNALPVITPYVQVNGGGWLQQNAAQVCSGNSVVLGPQPVSTTGWSWTGPNGYASATREISLADISSNQSGVYTASYTINGCTSTQTFNLSVSSLPNAPAVGSPVTYCQNANASPLMATGADLKWYTVSVGGTSSSTAPVPSTTSAGTTNHYVSQTTNGCESSRATITVMINSLPDAIITPSGPTTFVTGGSVTLNANTGTGLNYKWFNGTAQVGTGSSYETSTTGSYTLEVTNGSGCKAISSATSVTVNYNQPSVITIISPVSNSSVSGPITITATVSGPDGGITKVEYLAGTTVIGTSTSSPYMFAWDNPTAGDHVITVRVTDSNGGVTTSSPVTVTSNSVTGIQGTTEIYGKVYPNPVSGELTIETAMDLDNAKVTVINVLGEEIQLPSTMNGNGVSIDVSILSEGTYLLIIKKETLLLRKKISVIR